MLKLGAASGFLNDSDNQKLVKYAACVKSRLDDQLVSTLRAESEGVSLISYSSDATLLRVHWRQQDKPTKDCSAVRAGSVASEFLMQNISVKRHSSTALLALWGLNSRGLSRMGKAQPISSAVTVILCKRWQSMRFCPTMGCKYGFLFSTVVSCLGLPNKFWDSHQTLLQDAGISHSSSRSVNVLQVWCGCALHDTHNALKWCLGALLTEGGCALRLKAVHENLRKSLYSLIMVMPLFLRSRMQIRGSSTTEDSSEPFWRSLGIAVDWLPLFVAIDPRMVNDISKSTLLLPIAKTMWQWSHHCFCMCSGFALTLTADGCRWDPLAERCWQLPFLDWFHCSDLLQA